MEPSSWPTAACDILHKRFDVDAEFPGRETIFCARAAPATRSHSPLCPCEQPWGGRPQVSWGGRAVYPWGGTPTLVSCLMARAPVCPRCHSRLRACRIVDGYHVERLQSVPALPREMCPVPRRSPPQPTASSPMGAQPNERRRLRGLLRHSPPAAWLVPTLQDARGTDLRWRSCATSRHTVQLHRLLTRRCNGLRVHSAGPVPAVPTIAAALASASPTAPSRPTTGGAPATSSAPATGCTASCAAPSVIASRSNAAAWSTAAATRTALLVDFLRPWRMQDGAGARGPR